MLTQVGLVEAYVRILEASEYLIGNKAEITSY
jgi:hypothetical protein